MSQNVKNEHQSEIDSSKRRSSRLVADIILIFVLLLVALSLFLVFFFTGDTGVRVSVIVDGEELASYSLDKNISVEIPTEWGNNTLVIEDGMAYVSRADCPDGICAAHRPINKSGDTIVCLPHRLVVKVN